MRKPSVALHANTHGAIGGVAIGHDGIRSALWTMKKSER